ncbi:RagB/SusD family nutrient uptake outer membrane protein [uncultured Winogradskyella sp.]|uniref:RagB/SusD family nutrient uptake outer membrane protein n=1 Tax=uncultured Winogradskyella sp. TaxID=395353 RepID=UPI00262D5A5F|nr:RagB/SusD family nutrient uptake outer membrane protein [uncultured Winogradskyella sp.]
MKNISKLILLSLIAVFTSCNDAIDIDQVGRLRAENAFSSVDDLEAGLLAVYGQLDLTPEIALSANFTDEIAIGFDSGGQGFALYDFVLNAESAAASSFWVRNFIVNNRATVLLEAAENVEILDEDEQERFNNVLAQTHFIRAFSNFELLIYFSPDPRDDSTLAVPVVDFVPEQLTFTALRDTTGEVWDYINADVNRALELSTVEFGGGDFTPTFASVQAINALRARMAITRGQYGVADALATDLLNTFGLADRTQYQNMFLDSDNTEIIWKLERTLNDAYDGQGATGSVFAGGWAGARFAFGSATLDGSPYFEMDRSVFDLLDPADIRFTVNVAPTSVISNDYLNDPDPVNNDILVIQKYIGSEGQPLMNDLKVFRSSEMLLIAAEARAAGPAQDLAGAAALIKQLRDARFGTDQPLDVYNSQQEAFQAILQERKIELCYEGHRYKDLKRLGPDANVGVDRDPIACEIQSGACELPATDFRFTLPIPIVEINANPGIAAQQNPGY